jgi:exodeoxyribonuclease III
VTVLCWNIGRGGGTRVARIVEELAAHDADVVALTEFRARAGAELAAELRTRGWVYFASTGPVGNEDGIAVFSRSPVVATIRNSRWIEVGLPEFGFALGVLRIMAASGGAERVAKTRFWESLIADAAARVGEPLLWMGGWNTGLHGVDEKGKTFVCAEHFARLTELGWVDLWRRFHPGTTEWTCRSRQSGFRLDHAFGTPVLLPRVSGCRYSHAEREARVSGHSITLVEIDAAC